VQRARTRNMDIARRSHPPGGQVRWRGPRASPHWVRGLADSSARWVRPTQDRLRTGPPPLGQAGSWSFLDRRTGRLEAQHGVVRSGPPRRTDERLSEPQDYQPTTHMLDVTRPIARTIRPGFRLVHPAVVVRGQDLGCGHRVGLRWCGATLDVRPSVDRRHALPDHRMSLPMPIARELTRAAAGRRRCNGVSRSARCAKAHGRPAPSPTGVRRGDLSPRLRIVQAKCPCGYSWRLLRSGHR
jgi:hypothetical protein